MNPDKIVKFSDSSGQEFTLYFGMRAFRAFEIETGSGIIQVFSTMDTVKMTDLATMVKVGLETYHSTINSNEVDDLIDDVGLNRMLELLGEAVSKSLPKSGNQRPPLTAVGKNR